MSIRSARFAPPLLSCLLTIAACKTKPEEPTSREATVATSAPASNQDTSPVPTSPETVPGGDPFGGKFTLEQATEGLPPGKTLVASIETSLGTLSCELFADKAPITVANFVGLARGKRPFQLGGEWVTRPGYDGTTFHRVIKGFMIQGGDPLGNGSGEPGYVIPDEIWEGSKHDRRGLLCMANRGKNTNGMQFFITDAAAPHLDGGYTIFGSCGPEKTIEALASVPVQGDRAVSPTQIKKITIQRKP